MGDIIKQWLTLKLGLEIPNTDDPFSFARDLANGVLIAEILRKYGILSDDEFISLRHNNTEKTKLSNMRHIKNWLNGTGLEIKDSDLEDIAIKEKSDVGAKLLYELYLWFEYGPRVPNVHGETKKFFVFGKEGSYASETGRAEVFPRQSEKRVMGWQFHGDSNSRKPQFGKSYSIFDRPEYPSRVALEKPFARSSEAYQAEHIYFNHRALEVLEKQEADKRSYARDRELRLREFREEGKGLVSAWSSDFKTPDHLDSVTIQARKKANAKQTLDNELQNNMDDMEKFNWILDHQPPVVESCIPVYADGRGDNAEYELKIKLLKCKRDAEIRDEEERKIFRKEIMNRSNEQTALKMTKGLEDDVLKTLTSLPAYESLLADFIRRCYKERNHFIQQAIYVINKVQDAHILDLEKEIRIKKQEEDFLEYVEAEEANPHKNFDFMCRVLEEPDLVEKLASADATIRDMIERALKIKQAPVPPPPPCTPTFTHKKRCRQVMHETFGPILVCEDDPGEHGDYRYSICQIMPPANYSSQMNAGEAGEE